MVSASIAEGATSAPTLALEVADRDHGRGAAAGTKRTDECAR